MNKKRLILSSFVFTVFAGVPFFFFLVQGNVRDAIIVAIILLAVLGVTMLDYSNNRKSL
ncbi:hypothetical protein ANABIO32_06650 [Rossellomorea marisflavi]|uniref:hypothetical protein n=1 Tax=Rossellomorea marisflavi TaxID=189381 RepID=UPI0025C8742C|nr:hypothetical protein [Rossellomorea marisflavi]GLI82977.1 hypothetical protein ANABIO32_06650 [Rossellomorea marisflavi]